MDAPAAVLPHEAKSVPNPVAHWCLLEAIALWMERVQQEQALMLPPKK